MTSVPTFAIRPTFLGVEQTSAAAGICVAGIPFDLGTSNRPGARFAPAAIRQASRMLVDGDHPASWAEMERLDVADIGDFHIAHGDIQGTLVKIEAQAAPLDHLVALGGDHTVTLPLLRALASRRGALGLVHFDGHVDTWPESFGLVWGHGSPFYHAIEEGLVDPRRMIQVGIRSPLHREIFDWTVGKGVTIVTAEDVHESGPKVVAEKIRSVLAVGSPISASTLTRSTRPSRREPEHPRWEDSRPGKCGRFCAGSPACALPGWMSSRSLHPMTSPRSQRSQRRRSLGITSACWRRAEDFEKSLVSTRPSPI